MANTSASSSINPSRPVMDLACRARGFRVLGICETFLLEPRPGVFPFHGDAGPEPFLPLS